MTTLPVSDAKTLLTAGEHGALRALHLEISLWRERAKNFHAAAAEQVLERTITDFVEQPDEATLREIELQALLQRDSRDGRYTHVRRAVQQACQRLFIQRGQAILVAVATRVLAAVQAEQAELARRECEMRRINRDLLPAEMGESECSRRMRDRIEQIERAKADLGQAEWADYPPDIERLLAALVVPFQVPVRDEKLMLFTAARAA